MMYSVDVALALLLWHFLLRIIYSVEVALTVKILPCLLPIQEYVCISEKALLAENLVVPIEFSILRAE